MLGFEIMDTPTLPTPTRSKIPYPLQDKGRPVMSLVAAAIGFFATMHLPTDMRLIICFDLAALTYVGLFIGLMTVAQPEDCVHLSTRSRWRNFHLLLLILLTLVGVAVIPVLMHINNSSPLLRTLDYGSSLLAIALAWLVAHISFGLHYMHMYYSDTIPDDDAEFDEGMAYPERKMPDYWDFMYYSFTIAMCYQTSDVTITNPKVRRVTLLHAIYSFFFVAAILGLVINILSNLI
jgi:uncharacterized membrane protein